MTILVELCAGSAAVSLRWLRSGAKPPLAWQGGKRGYADAILRAMGQQPGAGRGHDVVLVEPGPWGEAWELWRTEAGRLLTIDRLRAWQDEDPRTLWDRLRRAPVPGDVEERVAVWAVLQYWKFGRFPVRPKGEEWVMEGGFNAADAYNVQYRAGRPEDHNAISEASLRSLVVSLSHLPDLTRLTVLRCRAEDVAPIPGALVYIDPPYRGTTCAYGHDLPDVEALALRWRASGCAVTVSESKPLALPGWHAHRLPRSSGFGRTWSKQQEEWLTMSRPAAGQIGLSL